MRVGMMREMGWQVDEEVNPAKNGEADGMNLEVDSNDEVMQYVMFNVWCLMLFILSVHVSFCLLVLGLLTVSL